MQPVPDLKITVGGREYTVRLGVPAIIYFERATGKRLLKIIATIWRKFGAAWELDKSAEGASRLIPELLETLDLTTEEIMTLVWALIGGEKSGVTVMELAESVTMADLEPIWEMIRGVLEEHGPEASETDKDQQPDPNPESRPTA